MIIEANGKRWDVLGKPQADEIPQIQHAITELDKKEASLRNNNPS